MQQAKRIFVDGQPKANVGRSLVGWKVVGRLVESGDEQLLAEFEQPDVLPELTTELLETEYRHQVSQMERKGLTDGATVSPVAYYEDGDTLVFVLGQSSYGRHLAATTLFKALNPEYRMSELRKTKLGTAQKLSHTAGVNGTLVAGEQLILSVRGKARVGTERGALASTFSQGTRLSDLEGGKLWTPQMTSGNGLLQEFGLPPDTVDDLTVHTLIAQDDGGLSFLAHGSTSLSADEVIRSTEKARDKWEHSEYVVVDFTPAGMEKLVTDLHPKANWFGPAVIGAMEQHPDIFGHEAIADLTSALASPSRGITLG